MNASQEVSFLPGMWQVLSKCASSCWDSPLHIITSVVTCDPAHPHCQPLSRFLTHSTLVIPVLFSLHTSRDTT